METICTLDVKSTHWNTNSQSIKNKKNKNKTLQSGLMRFNFRGSVIVWAFGSLEMGRHTAGGTLVQLQAFPHNDLKCQSCSGATSRGCPPSRLPNGPWALIWMAPALRRMSRANRGSSSSGPRAGVSVTGVVKETFHPSFRGEGRKRDAFQKKKTD